jgi:hypothetical protein
MSKDLIRRIQMLEARVVNVPEKESLDLSLYSEEEKQALFDVNLMIQSRGSTLEEALQNMSSEERERVREVYRPLIWKERKTAENG